MSTFTIEPFTYNWSCRVYETRRGDGVIYAKRFSELRPELYMKYRWYFLYLAALAQVRSPKGHVEVREWRAPANGQTLVQLLKQREVSARRESTRCSNLLAKAIENWSCLFPIQQDELYQKAERKANQKAQLHRQAFLKWQEAVESTK